MKLAGTADLVSRGMKVLQAVPATYPFRSADRDRPRDEGVGDGISSSEESRRDAETPGGGEQSGRDAEAARGWQKGSRNAEAAYRGHQHTVRHPDALVRGRDRGSGMADEGVWVSGAKAVSRPRTVGSRTPRWRSGTA